MPLRKPRLLSDRVWHGLMRLLDQVKDFRRQLIRLRTNPRLAFLYVKYRRAIRAADWPAVRRHVLTLTDLAVRAGDRRTVAEMKKALNRLGLYQESSRLWLTEIAPRLKRQPKEWRGEDLSGKSVLVDLDPPDQGLGTAYRCASPLAKVAGLAGRTAVVVEPRLLKTFSRSFPELEILSSHSDAQSRAFDFLVLPEFLIAQFTPDNDRPDPDFRPLLPDRSKATALRTKYLKARRSQERKLLVGISWHSSHHGKDLPALRYWRDFIARTNATFVSLQYGNVANDVAALGRDQVIVDEAIDQMADMDAFDAQVAALDGVITIINTLANVGGALDVPTVVLRDDWFRRALPVSSDRVPWHPSVRIVGKDRRDWDSVLDEAWAKLRELLAERSPARTA
jgi:hypothetical protein